MLCYMLQCVQTECKAEVMQLQVKLPGTAKIDEWKMLKETFARIMEH